MKKIIVVLVMLLLLFPAIKANAQWVQMSNGLGNSNYIYSLGANGTNVYAGLFSDGVYCSANNGGLWTQTPLNNRWVEALISNETNLFAGTVFHGVYRTSNSGINWTQTALTDDDIWALSIKGNYIFAGSNNGVYRSTNDGNNWAYSQFNRGINSLAVNGNNLFAGTNAGVYLSTNNGINWAQTSLGDKTVWPLAVSGGNVIAGTEDSNSTDGVYLSSNNGANWVQTSLNNMKVYSLVAVGNNVFAGTFYMGVYQSTNNGLNWILINQGFSSYPYVLSLIITNNYIYAGTYGQSLWRRPLSELVSTQNTNTGIPTEYLLYQNFPNPFNPSTTIRYELPRAGVVRLAVYDVMGREVEMLVNERQAAGSYEAVWDGTRFASGVYFYRLTAEGYGETRKMLLIR